MGADPVAWMIDGGAALHSASLGRKFAYAALGGNDGVIGATDCEVRELAVPGTKVRVYPGIVAIRNRANNVLNETYLGSVFSETQIDIAATTASGPRSDMICARVENPYIDGEPWPDPSDPTTGPYFKLVVISNVGNTATVPPAGAGNAVLPLSRIDLPASTATVIQSYCKDLRYMANVLQSTDARVLAVPGQHTLPTSQNTYITWPNPPMGSQTVRVPSWATKAVIRGVVAVVQIPNGGNARGDIRAGIGTQRTGAIQWDYDTTGTTSPDRQNLVFGGEIDIPASYRGTTQSLLTEARGYTVASGNTVPIYAEVYSTVSIDVTFKAVPASNA